ncbi:unnamed protein product [Callosobruchus maculatus]|uniref:SMP-LTD domain-containing protein n=1 Tax=Callosobruchus maculatus TaxID=64391 RepID=A0A653C0S2_CALMS|nr:unnamed protein product [Callosobruchus maculatus]
MDNNNKCKSATTSVPSISIKFHANAEQLEEIHTDDEESASSTCTGGSTDKGAGSSDKSTVHSSTSPVTNIMKRSTSIDVSSSLSQQQDKQATDSSPPASDPWRFFSDIKSRNQEEGSPHHKQKASSEQPKTTKDSKENSSVSDSEDLSESSISRTCGILSTTEGVEMSSDEEDTPSMEKEKKKGAERPTSPVPPTGASSCGLRQRFRFLRAAGGGGGGHKGAGTAVEGGGTVKINDLSKLYNVNAEKVDQVLPEQDDDGGDEDEAGRKDAEEVEVESAVDALDDATFDGHDHHTTAHNRKAVSEKYDNIEVDQRDNVVTVKEVTGKEIREDFLRLGRDDKTRTLFAPSGYYGAVGVASICICYLIYQICPFFCGLAVGVTVSFLLFEAYTRLNPPLQLVSASTPSLQGRHPPAKHCDTHRILEIQAVKEYQPLFKYEGWVNEYPERYDPASYHISKTQSVWVRLQGNLLRLSHAKNHKVSKRAMWNEPTQQQPTAFTHHRIYNMIGAKITLLPVGLAKKRHWSKKYPICITLAKDQLYFDNLVAKSDTDKEKCDCKENKEKDKEKLLSVSPKERKSFGRFRRKDYSTLAQRFSKLTEDEDIDLDSDSRASTPSADVSDIAEFPPIPDEETTNQNKSPNIDSLNEEWSLCSPTKEPSRKSPKHSKASGGKTEQHQQDGAREATPEERNQQQQQQDPSTDASETTDQHVLWLNALIGRVLFDCMRDDAFILRVKERVQRKLSTIKLPNFIEELLVSELSLGRTSPVIGKTGKPLVDERGVWIELDVAYEGDVRLTLQTKLNLMRLKNPQTYGVSTEIKLTVELKSLSGTVVLNMPPPPSDRIWVGFRPLPEILLSARPVVGERNISYFMVTSWIEKKLLQEFQKILVVPNMEDFIIPVMNPKLPD